MDKRTAQELQQEFFPRGPEVDTRTLQFRRTDGAEIFRCCVASSYDIQSGPIYCGAVAEYVAFAPVEGDQSFVGLCGKRGHVPPPGTLQKQATTPA